MERFLGAIKKLIPRATKRTVIAASGKDTMLVGPDTLVSATDFTRKVVDFPKARVEAAVLGSKINDAIGASTKAPMVINSIQAGRRLQQLGDTFFDDIITIQATTQDRLRKVESGEATVVEAASAHFIDTGVSLVAFRNLNEQLAIARAHGQGRERFEEMVKLCLFSYCGLILIRLGEVRLVDFIYSKGKAKSPSPYYDYLIQTLLVVPRNTHQEILKQNQEPPFCDYPNITTQTIDVMTNKMAFLLALGDQAAEGLAGIFQDSPYPLNSAGQLAGNLISKISEVRKNSLDALTHPESKYFQAMKRVLSPYLGSDKGVIRRALFVLTPTSGANFQSLYRFASYPPSPATEEDLQFYSRLASEVREYATSIRDFLGLLGNEDILSILSIDEETGEGSPNPSDLAVDFSNLSQSVSEIFYKSSQRSYPVDPIDIEWGNLYVPQAVKVDFDQERPHKFKVSLSFSNEVTQETTDVEFDLDTTRKKMDLNILDDPNRPQSSLTIAFRTALVAATRSILTSVRKQAGMNYLTRHPFAVQPVVPPSPTQKRQRFSDPIYQLRKEARLAQSGKEASPPTQSEDQASIVEVTFSDRRVVNHIVIPEEKEMVKMLSPLASVDQKIILGAIQEFNERGTGGDLTKKKKKGIDGLPRWTLSIGCTVPKGVRVLLIPETTAQGVRSFRIDDIRYRKDIYKRNFL